MVLVLVFFEKIKDEKERVNLLALIEKMLFFNTLTSYRYYLFDDFSDEFFLELAVELAKDNKTPNGVLSELHDKWRTRVTRTDLVKEIVQHFKGEAFIAGMDYGTSCLNMKCTLRTNLKMNVAN